MSTLATLVVRLTTDASELERGLGQAQKSSQSFLAGVGKNVQRFGKAALLGLGAAGGAAAGLGAALGGLAADAAPLETVRDSFGSLAEDAGSSQEEMLGALEKGSSGMIAQRDLMLQFNKAAQLVSTDFASQMPDAMQYVGKVAASTGEDFGFLMDSLVTGVGRLSPAILDNLSIQASLSEATDAAAEMFGVEAEELTKAQKQAGMMEVVMAKLAKNTASMPEVAGSAAAGMNGLRATIQNTKDRLGTAFLPVLNSVASMLTAMAPLLDPLISALETRLVPALDKGIDALGGVRWVIEDMIAGVWGRDYPWEDVFPPSLANAAYTISDAVFAVIDAVSPYVQIASAWIKENVELQDVLIALGAAIAAVVIPALASVVAAAAPVIATGAALIAAVTLIRNAWQSNWLGIRDTVRTALTFIQERLTKSFQIWKDIFNAFKSAFQGDWRGFGENLRAAWDKTWSAIQDAVQNAIQAIKSIDWGNVGRAITRGIANGIKNGAQAIVNAAKAAARAALEAAKGFLGIDSPSKAFAEVGQWASLGLARGLEDTSPVERAAESLGQSALRATQQTGQSVQRIDAPVNVEANVSNDLDLEELAWRVSEIIGRRSMEYAV